MNKQFEHLMYESGLTAQCSWNAMDRYDQDAVSRFAELVVKECANILMTPKYVMTHPEEVGEYNRGWVNGRVLGVDQIKERFGL